MDGPSRAPDLRFSFTHEADAPRQARHAIEALFPDTSDPVWDAIRLTASELVSNVVMHTDNGGMLRAWGACRDAAHGATVDTGAVADCPNADPADGSPDGMRDPAAGDPATLGPGTQEHRRARLEVEDFAATTALTSGSPRIVGGRGLNIVERVADAWGVAPTDRGKIVWAEFG